MKNKGLIIGGLVILGGTIIYLMTKLKKITKIISTEWTTADVPYGSTIGNTVTWDAYVSGAGNKDFKLITFFFTKIGGFAFFSEQKLINSGTASGNVTTLDFNTLDILDEPSIYQTYDATTYVGDGDNPNFPYGGEGVYDEVFDVDALTII